MPYRLAASMTVGHWRILHLQTDDGISGGVANYISNLVNSKPLSGQSNFVVVPGMRSHRSTAHEMYPSATSVCLPRSFGLSSFVDYYQQLRHLVDSLDVDLIHAHALRCALPAAMVSKQSNVPLIYTNHGLRYSQKAGRLTRRTFLAAERFVTRRASAVVAIRPYDLERMKSDDAAPSDKSHLVETRLNQSPATHRCAPGHRPTLLGVGSLIPVKRPMLFLEWVAALRSQGLEFDAVWAGEGPLQAEMTRAAAAMHVPVTFVGHLSRASLDQLYRTADVLLLSSEFETFSMAVLEAMAHGVPTVTTNFPGVGDLVSDGVTGIVVDRPDADCVADAIATLLSNRKTWKLLSENCVALYRERHYNIDVMASSYAAIYDSITSGEDSIRD